MSDEIVLTDNEIEEVNRIIMKLQEDLTKVEKNIKSRNFNEALKNIVEGMKHTECPVCREKLLQLSASVIETKSSCNDGKNTCEILIRESSEKASDIKNDFIPISTEKKAIKDKKERISKQFPEILSPVDLINMIINPKQ